MENMNDIKFFEVEKPKIPTALLEATYESMRVGGKRGGVAVPGESEGNRSSDDEDHNNNNNNNMSSRRGKRELKGGKKKQEERSRRHKKKMVEEELEPEEPMFRSHGGRRKGFLVIGDQHRFGHGGGKVGASASYLYPEAPPIDYSFSLLSAVEEIIIAGEPPNTKRSHRFPDKTDDDRYKTSSVRISYNLLEHIEGIVGVLYKILDGGPFGLKWLDLSFNHIRDLDEDSLAQIPNLKILYLHGNLIADMKEIQKLQILPNLMNLTVHGNPIEEEEWYRACTLFYLPDLKHLDFIGVTKTDMANAGKFGRSLEPYWLKRHIELENQSLLMKAAEEISYTEQMMKQKEEDETIYDFR